MADTNRLSNSAPVGPVEGDGVNYRGIVWFVVILTATTVFCQILVWGLFRVFEYRAGNADAAIKNPMAVESKAPSIQNGRMERGIPNAPQPALLVNEPVNLKEFRATEERELSTYGWADKMTQAVRLPIDKGKDVVLQKGLPVRQVEVVAPVTTPAPKNVASPAKPGVKPAVAPKAGK